VVTIANSIVGGVNFARTNLRTKIHDGLYPKEREFLYGECPCHKDGLVAYKIALGKTGVWPLEDVMHGKDAKSISDILKSIVAKFKYYPPNRTCRLCSTDITNRIIKPAITRVRKNFEGLCIDCIKNPVDREGRESGYDKHCRIEHGQPTWWFSWLSSEKRKYENIVDKEEEEEEEEEE